MIRFGEASYTLCICDGSWRYDVRSDALRSLLYRYRHCHGINASLCDRYVALQWCSRIVQSCADEDNAATSAVGWLCVSVRPVFGCGFDEIRQCCLHGVVGTKDINVND